MDSQKLAPVDLHALTVSDAGFATLLTTGKRVLPLRINDVDTQEARSSEALTLMQLFQGIDMGTPLLCPERLRQLLDEALESGAAAPIEAALWGQDEVALRELAVLGRNNLILRVGGGGEATVDVPSSSPFEGIALALRYRSKLSASVELLERDGVSLDEAAARFPIAFTARDAREQGERVRRDFAQQVSSALGTDGEGAAATDQPVNANELVPRALLERALAIAREKGDFAAEVKLLAKLRESDAADADSE